MPSPRLSSTPQQVSPCWGPRIQKVLSIELYWLLVPGLYYRILVLVKVHRLQPEAQHQYRKAAREFSKERSHAAVYAFAALYVAYFVYVEYLR